VTSIVEQQSFVTFVDQHQSSLLKFAMVLTGDFRRSEDMVADALGQAFERWDRIGLMESPLAYVRRMITNQFLSTQRRHVVWLRRRSQVAGQDHLPDPTGDIDRREAMIAQLAQLPPRQRSVVVMRYYLDLTDAEIAEHLGCRPATVRSHAARALIALRVDLTNDRDTTDRDTTDHTDETGRR
jgi:RNA polymerase sigma-70 factor (sigma-E family)